MAMLLTSPSLEVEELAADFLFVLCKDQRTNGPVNAHLRSTVYTNVIENSPSIGADEALGPFCFFRIINILSIQVFPFK